MQYRFHNAELGVMYEIMLPKKIQYQDFLFNSLVNGLRTFSYTKYFRENKESFMQLFEDYTDAINLKKNDLELFDANYLDMIKGYSMYEVYGVFRQADSYNFDEELTQIVRLYFIPDYAGIAKKFPGFTINEIQTYADMFFSLYKNMYRRQEGFPASPEILLRHGLTSPERYEPLHTYYTHWVDAAMLCVFGYIVHEICRHLSTYFEEKKLKELEKEIWVTSHWGILINRNILKQ
jgi:hypothetical protein